VRGAARQVAGAAATLSHILEDALSF